ncbi:MAG: DNA repair exonuclease [Clostridia bacterium]|nr:DNA repair exonuclease [Clostridia bacterium]
MKKVKFLHCADIHLDTPFTSLSGGKGRASIRRQDLKDVFGDIIYRVKSENVELLLISGDLYEHNYVRKSTINHINDLFREIPDTKVFIVPGNHDPFIINSYYYNFKWSENVFILTSENPYVVLDDMGVCIYGVGFRNFYEEKSLTYNITSIDKTYINILLVHGTVDVNIKQNMYNPMDSKNLSGMGMDYIALGHFHNRIDDIGGYGVIYNPGSPEALGFDETGNHGAFIGTLSKDYSGNRKLDIEFIKLGKRFYKKIEIDVSGCCTNEQIASLIEDSLVKFGDSATDAKSGLFSITLTGYTDKDFKIDSSFIQECLYDKTFFIKVCDETDINYDFGELMKEAGLRGLFTRKIYSLIEKTEDAYEKRLLMKALYYGLEALETGKVEIN